MKKAILTGIQVLVTVGILIWVFHDHTKRHEMWEALQQAFHRPGGVEWLMTGFACYGVVELLAAGRWFLLLRVQDVELPLWRVGALFMLGIFFNLFMPGGTGGDVLKVYFLLKEIPKNKAAKGLLAVLMDRLIGLLALIMVSSVIIVIQYQWLQTTPVSRSLTWVLMLILVASLAGIVFSFVISGFGLAHKLPVKMPMRDQLIDVSKAYNAYAKAWPASLACLVGSFGVHLSMFMLFVCAARALNVNISTGALLTVMPIILTISAMPISVGGAGVREGLFAALLGPLCGVSQAEAVTLSLTGFMLQAAWGTLGGIIYLGYRPSAPKIRDMERQVHAFEHEIAESDTAETRTNGSPVVNPVTPDEPHP
jgi:uncharacterized protein (TIRG00374 family)